MLGDKMIRIIARRGFTLVELLVVITIIGILIALLLPAVQAAREAARRMQCNNNLKQLGMAAHLHLEAKNALPPGHYWPAGGINSRAGAECVWVAYLLPYLEMSNLYEKINWSQQFGTSSVSPYYQREVVSARPSVLICPSNEAVDLLYDGAYARLNYAANNGLGPMAEAWTNDIPIKRSRQIQVGGNTVTVSGQQLAGVFFLNSGTPDELHNGACVSVPDAPCIEAFPSWNARQLIMTTRSSHPGGVNSLLGDGSTHFVGDSVAVSVWQALGTPKALPGESVSGDF
jgi:prepilin-type N-terminal cleavage/methylation domain-containing protein